MYIIINVYIFARNKSDEGKLITNLISIIGYENVIKKSGANPPAIQLINMQNEKELAIFIEKHKGKIATI